jgi:hypothetical protein
MRKKQSIASTIAAAWKIECSEVDKDSAMYDNFVQGAG